MNWIKRLSLIFPGVRKEIDPLFNQKHLEKAVHDMPKGDRFDYCFVWCLLNHYYLSGRTTWEKIVAALKKAPAKYFSKVDGWVKRIGGLTGFVARKIGAAHMLKRAFSIDIGDYSENEMIKQVNKFIGKNKLEYYFIMKRYYKKGYDPDEFMHYNYVTHAGTEMHSYPNLHKDWIFFGWRVYVKVKI